MVSLLVGENEDQSLESNVRTLNSELSSKNRLKI